MHPARRAYDTVIIGAGLGGLGAALELATNGGKSLLLEQHNLPGGFATSFVRGRFEFEPSLHEIGSAGFGQEKGGLRKYFEDEIEADIEFRRVPDAYRLILTEKNIDVRMPFGVQPFIDTLERHVPGCGKQAGKYIGLCKDVADAFAYLASAGKDYDKKVLFREHGNFLKTAAYTMKDIADRLAISEALKDLIYPYHCYLGTPESRTSFSLWAAMFYSYIAGGAVVPRYRSHEIASAMVAKIELHGGDVEFNTRVESILVEKGRVKGVVTSRGEVISAGVIVSNAGPPVVYTSMITPETEVP